jgi:penicillin-binding protein 1C
VGVKGVIFAVKRSFFFLVLCLVWGGAANALPSFDEVRKSYVKSDSLLLDRYGEMIHELRVDKTGRRLDWTSLQNISPALKEAVIQAEDKRFYGHGGIDYLSMSSALIQGLTSESLRGASTITMQLASLLDRKLQSQKRRRSVWQKKKQILDAREIEKIWSKAEIVEAYLNLVTFRGELQGIAAASRALFGKDPHGLGRAESLLLASLIRSPNASFTEVIKRAIHLNRSMEWHMEEDEIHSKGEQVFLGPNFLRPRAGLAPHIARQLLQGLPKGSTLFCTLDREIQQFSLDRLTHHLSSLRSHNVKDGAILIIENRTGNVLAYVSHSGKASYGRFVDGVQGKRQAGSTLKPFLYAFAFDRRILTPASILDDTPLDIAVIRGIYQPRNYDSEFKGFVTSRVALASSLNIPAVRTLFLVGIEPFLNKLQELGIKGLDESGDFYGPSLALGSADVSLWELVNAYRTLANAGIWNKLHVTLDGPIFSKPKQVFSKEAVFLISDILSDREARGITFGFENPLSTRFWSAVKTGTSKDMRDNWCIGYSRKYTVGVWVGNFSGDSMWNVSGITGAAPIWGEMMNFLHRNEERPKKEPPPNLVSKQIQFSRNVESMKKEWFIPGTEPNLEEKRIGQVNQRILYPPSGAVIALDPDIPPEMQKVFFISQVNEDRLQWMLNEKKIEKDGRAISWTPNTGTYLLSLVDDEDRIMDSVHFEVRGPRED